MKIEYDNQIIEFAIEYKKRKTVQIKMEPTGMLRVLAPKGANEKVIIDIIKSKAPLILEKLKELRQTLEEIKEKEEKKLLYLGTEYAVKITIDESMEKDSVTFEKDIFIIIARSSEKEICCGAIEKFYRKKCSEIIRQRIAYYQKHFKIKPKTINIIDSKHKWGSCNINRSLDFNWKLIMAPIEVIDYIVVHEMCHLLHMNHSKSFWTLVGKIIPDYKERSEWLQYNTFRMKLYF